MNKTLQRFVSGVVTSSTLLATKVAFGQGFGTPPPGTGVGNQLPGGAIPSATGQKVSATQLAQLITNTVSLIASLVMTVAIVMILYAGFKFMTAGDDEDGVTKARKILTYGVVGIVVALLAYSLPAILSTFVTGQGQG